jgi:hypothetical protein
VLVRDLCKSEQAEGLPMEAVPGDGKYKNSHWIFLLLVLLPEFFCYKLHRFFSIDQSVTVNFLLHCSVKAVVSGWLNGQLRTLTLRAN